MESTTRPPMLHVAGSTMLMMQPSSSHFLQRSGPGFWTDREHLSELEHKLVEARQRFQDLKDEKCNASSKICECGCCPHGYVRARDQKASSIYSGPDSRSISETSNLPVRKTGSNRQHLARSETTGAEHGSPSSEGLLLAVDKFLSAK